MLIQTTVILKFTKNKGNNSGRLEQWNLAFFNPILDLQNFFEHQDPHYLLHNIIIYCNLQNQKKLMIQTQENYRKPEKTLKNPFLTPF